MSPPAMRRKAPSSAETAGAWASSQAARSVRPSAAPCVVCSTAMAPGTRAAPVPAGATGSARREAGGEGALPGSVGVEGVSALGDLHPALGHEPAGDLADDGHLVPPAGTAHGPGGVRGADGPVGSPVAGQGEDRRLDALEPAS